MATISELMAQREYKYKDLIFFKNDIQEFIKFPLETVSTENLIYQYQMLLSDINNIDFSIKSIILTQIEWAKRDLKNLETQLSLIPAPFDVADLPSYSEIFK
ncbi:hypothetical protein [Flavobacterium sp.]|uniref:hypothetical protein n=1 Tax=Flavobacterium sp. TaxID=239 RepID=UPI003750E966